MFAEVIIAKVDKRWTIKEHYLKGFDAEQTEKHRTAQRMLETVVNSWEFRQEVLALVLTSKGTLTNGQIYNLIINGAEILSPEVDMEADIHVNAYRKKGSVVGYTYASKPDTFLNLNFFNKYKYDDVARNLMHEWLHKLGFGHKSAAEKTSVPYAIGNLAGDLVKHLMDGRVLHDVHDEDKIIDIIMGNSIPSTPYVEKLVCSRSWRNFFRKVCVYQ